MKQITIKLLSPTMIMSGQGDVNTDSTIVHDGLGIPYIPAKRFRGVLYESALEVAEMMELSGLAGFSVAHVNALFNRSSSESAKLVEDNPRLSISNLYIPDYDTVYSELSVLFEVVPDVFNKDRVLDEYTFVRYYTAIDEETGTAKDGTLHNSRVLNKGLVFEGTINVESMSDTDTFILACAARNLTGIGGKRNRGFGQIECIISDSIASESSSFDGMNRIVNPLDVKALGGVVWNK